MEDAVAAIVAYLELATRGVIILVHGAEDFQLRPLLKALLPRYPDLQICLDPAELEEVPVGSVVVLRPSPAHAPILNAGRPLVADRNLKLILWCDEENTIALQRRAPDFYDWISHLVELPKEVPGFALEGLRAAASRHAVVHWQGPQPVDVALAAAGQTIAARLAGAPSREDLASVANTGVSGWAVVEAPSVMYLSMLVWPRSRVDGAVAVLGDVAPTRSWRVHGRPRTLRDACEVHSDSSQTWRRFCVALELEPEAIDIARRLYEEREDDDAHGWLFAARDPGAFVACLMIMREADDQRSMSCDRVATGYVSGSLSPPLLRAVEGAREDLSRGLAAVDDRYATLLMQLRFGEVKLAVREAELTASRRRYLSVAAVLADAGNAALLRVSQKDFTRPEDGLDVALALRVVEARVALRTWQLAAAEELISGIAGEIPDSWGHLQGIMSLLKGQIEARKGRYAAAAVMLRVAEQRLERWEDPALAVDLVRASLEHDLLPDRVDFERTPRLLASLVVMLGGQHPDVAHYRDRLDYARRVHALRTPAAA